MVVGAGCAVEDDRVVDVHSPTVGHRHAVGLNSRHRWNDIVHGHGVRGGGLLSGWSGHGHGDRLLTGHVPARFHLHTCGVVVVGWISVVVGVDAGVNIPHKGSLLAKPVGRGGGIEFNRFTEGNASHPVIGHGRRQGRVQFQPNRHAQRLRSVPPSQGRIGVVHDQQQFFTIERGRHLPGQRLR